MGSASETLGGPAPRVPVEPGAESPPYLKLEPSTSEDVVTPTGRLMCKRLGCGSVWCGCGCGMHKGLLLRDALKRELESFQSPFFVTCTVDPEMFPEGPEGALKWVQEGGVLSEFVRSLRRGGHLLDTRYVWVLEFQEDSGFPHWHLIFDALRVPFSELCESWAAAGWAGKRGRERWGPRPRYEGKGQRPVFGSVQFRVKGREELGRLCHYLTKYVTKMPVAGWPEWITKTTRQLRRWSTSRDFWRSGPPPHAPKKVTEWSKLRGKYFDKDEVWEEDDEFLRRIGKREKTSIGDRLESCGKGSVVLEEVRVVPVDATPERVAWRYVGMIAEPVWMDPEEESPTFKLLDEVSPTSFVVNDKRGRDLLYALAGREDLTDGIYGCSGSVVRRL